MKESIQINPDRQTGHVGPDEGPFSWRDWLLFMLLVTCVGIVGFIIFFLMDLLFG